jgi:hypothetical protein
MFFYLIERAKENIDISYNIEAVSTIAYLILYSYVPIDLKFYFWALFTIDITITFYKKKIFDKIDEWYEDKTQPKENKQKKVKKLTIKTDEDIKTNKSGYFESALDEIEMESSSTGSMIDKMIKDSKSF